MTTLVVVCGSAHHVLCAYKQARVLQSSTPVSESELEELESDVFESSESEDDLEERLERLLSICWSCLLATGRPTPFFLRLVAVAGAVAGA